MLRARDQARVVVIGGGIAGLHCARELARRGCRVRLFEATGRFGGRIETGELEPGPGGKQGEVFKAEFGPMRFELDLQPRFSALLDEFGIRTSGFPPPTPVHPPVSYELAPDETHGGVGLSSLELLKLGVYRMFGQHASVGRSETQHGSEPRVRPSAAAERWLEALGDQDGSFDRLRQTAVMPGTTLPLRDLGLWNALSRVLSPMAVTTILHFGTFFHFLPENLSAVEWGIFWLRLFKLPPDETLSTIPDGVSKVPEALVADLRRNWSEVVELRPGHNVTALRPAASGRVQVEVESDGRRTWVLADRVVLALPKTPLRSLSARFSPEAKHALESVIGFPMVKVFCVVRTPPWWRDTARRRPQDGAWLVPTREIHYFPIDGPPTDYTMVMLYMDRPATSYWQPYVTAPDVHHSAEYNSSAELKKALTAALCELHGHWTRESLSATDTDLVEAEPTVTLASTSDGIRTDTLACEKASNRHPALNGAPMGVDPDRFRRWQENAIQSWAIRDWSREPFGAASHAWAPGAKSWEVRETLSAFALDGQSTANVHICGEAYSDYQGVIEGALRSADAVIDAVVREDWRVGEFEERPTAQRRCARNRFTNARQGCRC